LAPADQQVAPNGTATDPIADILSAEPATAETEPAAEAAPEALEAPPIMAPKRHRRPKPAPDDWKKNYSIFGGGF
jgi:hypothetical protein